MMKEAIGQGPVVGSLYTLGYAAPNASEQLDLLMSNPAMLLIDVRLSPRSRWWPHWTKQHLRARWGTRYSHEKRLGNIHYRDHTQLVVLCGPHPDQAIAGAVTLLQHGYSLALLCACRNEETCHRTLVAHMIVEALLASQGTPGNEVRL